MTEGRKHHRVDLVFYHSLLRCHVLIDLKVRAFQPADAGQMNFYLNWFKADMMSGGDEPPVGILLCGDKDGTEVEFATAGMDQQLFVSRYLHRFAECEEASRVRGTRSRGDREPDAAAFGKEAGDSEGALVDSPLFFNNDFRLPDMLSPLSNLKNMGIK